MNYLVDTHILFWFWTAPEKLSARIKKILLEKCVFVSLASVWEIALKHAKGKMQLPIESAGDILEKLEREAFSLMPIEAQHIIRSVELPPHHADPFDRLLIAQARDENLAFISADSQIAKYDVKLIKE